MISTQFEDRRGQIDAIIAEGSLDEAAGKRLCDLVGDGESPKLVDIEVVLYLLDHPDIGDSLRDGSAPKPLREAVVTTIRAVISMLGDWNGAPLLLQTDRLRRKFEREKRKYGLVRDKLVEKPDDEYVAKILKSYLATSPPAMFFNHLAEEFPEEFKRATELYSAEQQLLLGDERLLELLEFNEPLDDSDETELYRRINEVAVEIDDIDRAIRAILMGPPAETTVVAAALAVRQGDDDLARALLALVVEGSPYSAQAAAFAGRLAPPLTRDVLARFLVDFLHDKRPISERDIEEDALRQAVVVARTTLGLLDSPVDEVEHVHEEAEAVAARVRRAWQFCENWF